MAVGAAVRRRRRERRGGRARGEGPGPSCRPSSRPSSRPRAPGRDAPQPTATRAALRPLRRPLRPRDADAGARELEQAWVEARADPAFRARLDGLLRDYVGRPTPLYHAERLSERVGRPVYLKREDLLHTGAHKINNALGQALLATADGQAAGDRRDRRRPARCRDRHRVRAAGPRVRRVHGYRGHAPPAAERRADGAARAPRSSRSRPARARSRRRSARRSATGSRTWRPRTT